MSPVVKSPAKSKSAQRALEVRQTDDFTLNGRGDHPAWNLANPVPVRPYRRHAALAKRYATWFKTLWSSTGIYFLIDCADRRLSASHKPDMAHLWTEDVAEVFLWPDPATPLYLEYEISPFGSELVLMVHNQDKRYRPWLPFQYEGAKRVRKVVDVRGGRAEPGANISGWSTEIFIPSILLEPLANAQPRPGLTWRANVYRIDYDNRAPALFAYRNVGHSFHNPQKFGTLRFV